jgi:hypothetical protein
MLESGLIVMTAFISPINKDRSDARKLISNDDFIEIYCKASLETCETRDVKGLYKRARAGEIKNYTGIDSPYEVPENPELTIDTDNQDEFLGYLHEGNRLRKKELNYSINISHKFFSMIYETFALLPNSNIKSLQNITTTKRPIFILGMPRSGTSLVEQIISSHKEVYGAGEINILKKCLESEKHKYTTELQMKDEDAKCIQMESQKKETELMLMIQKLETRLKEKEKDNTNTKKRLALILKEMGEIVPDIKEESDGEYVEEVETRQDSQGLKREAEEGTHFTIPYMIIRVIERLR